MTNAILCVVCVGVLWCRTMQSSDQYLGQIHIFHRLSKTIRVSNIIWGSFYGKMEKLYHNCPKQYKFQKLNSQIIFFLPISECDNIEECEWQPSKYLYCYYIVMSIFTLPSNICIKGLKLLQSIVRWDGENDNEVTL